MRPTLHLSIVFLFCLCSYFASATTPIAGGNVSGHWSLTGSPFEINGNITIPADSALTIDAGVEVRFKGHYQLKVNGHLSALGTANLPVSFTADINWWGIRFDGISPTQDSSLFVHCIIEKGKANGTGNYGYGGGFFIGGFSKIRIQNCIIRNNYSYLDGGAIYCFQSSPLIYENEIYGNTTNGSGHAAIHCEYQSAPAIIGNQIYSNPIMAIYCGYSNPKIISNTITNHSNLGIECHYSNPKIINNIISGNGMGIYCEYSNPAIKGNLITGHSTIYGAGIRCRFSSSPYFVNNTITNNFASEFGGGIYCDAGSSPIIKNTIIWGNTSLNGGHQIALSQNANPSFHYVDLQGGTNMIYYFDAPNSFTGTFLSSFDSDPLFTNSSTGNYTLLPGSPCIDAGTLDTFNLSLMQVDLANVPRVCNNRIDMGAYEFCSTGVVEEENNVVEMVIYPNPTSDLVIFEISDPSLIWKSELIITNALGQDLMHIRIDAYATIVPVHELQPGLYFYLLKTDNETLKSGKIIRK